MWADFRNNMASRKNFDLRKLAAAARAADREFARDVSEYDIVAINAPWLGEAVKKNLVIPLDRLHQGGRPSRRSIFIPRSGRWAPGAGSSSAFRSIARSSFWRRARDLFEKDKIEYPTTFEKTVAAAKHFHAPGQGAIRHRLERRARHADRLDLHVPDGMLRRIDPADSEDEPRDGRRRGAGRTACGRRSSRKPACACSTICTS